MGSVFDKEPIISREQYIESVGCTFQPELREMVEPHLQEALKGYFEAQDKWGEAVLKAADAELQYIDITGKSSREREKISIGVLGSSKGQYMGYGETKYGRQASSLEQDLRKNAENIAGDNRRFSRSEIEYAVWTSLGGDKHSHSTQEQLDLLGSAAEAIRLIEIAKQRSEQPILIINKRVVMEENLKTNKAVSSIIIGKSFHFVENEGKLDVAINDAKRLTFEHMRNITYGGRSGVVGSARQDTVWSGVPASSMEIENLQAATMQNILKLDRHGKKPANLILKKLAGESGDILEEIQFGEHDNKSYIRHSSPGNNDSVLADFEDRTGIYVGKDLEKLIEQILNTEINLKQSSNWTSNLVEAFNVIKIDEDKNSKKSLFGEIASEADIEDFYS